MTGRGPPISLRRLVDEAEARDADTALWLDLRSGEVLASSPAWDLGPDAALEVDAAVDGWEVDPAIRPLPDASDLGEPGLVRAFVAGLPDPAAGAELARAFEGRGAFRRLRGALDRLGLRDAWDAHRRAAIAAWLRAWLEGEGLAWVEDLESGAAETRDR